MLNRFVTAINCTATTQTPWEKKQTKNCFFYSKSITYCNNVLQCLQLSDVIRYIYTSKTRSKNDT